MKMIILMENTCGDTVCECEHGLSVYVETEKHKLLVDTGQSAKTWINAEKCGVDLTKIDTLILSHGHYDHSGGILSFREVNQTAPIYMQRSATRPYYHDERYIGIDPKIPNLPNVHLIEGNVDLDGEISIFSGITGRKYWPQSNRVLSVVKNGEKLQDEFDHEQCVVIHGEKEILISGCAHNGILNILDRYQEIYGKNPDIVITGFHMMKKTDYNDEEIQIIEDTAKELKKTNTVFYSGHCTGEKAMNLMKPILGEQLIRMHSGMVIEGKNLSSGIRVEEAAEDDAEELLAIYAPYVEDTAISFEYDVPALEEFRERIRNTKKQYPFLKAVDENGMILGYCYAHIFIPRRAYDWSVETTIYIKKEERGRGAGRKLYETLESELQKMGVLNMNACIGVTDQEDEHLTNASIHFHEKMGFQMVGTFHGSGYKFDTWYDMAWMEKIIGEHKNGEVPDISIEC